MCTPIFLAKRVVDAHSQQPLPAVGFHASARHNQETSGHLLSNASPAQAAGYPFASHPSLPGTHVDEGIQPDCRAGQSVLRRSSERCRTRCIDDPSLDSDNEGLSRREREPAHYGDHGVAGLRRQANELTFNLDSTGEALYPSRRKHTPCHARLQVPRKPRAAAVLAPQCAKDDPCTTTSRGWIDRHTLRLLRRPSVLSLHRYIVSGCHMCISEAHVVLH